MTGSMVTWAAQQRWWLWGVVVSLLVGGVTVGAVTLVSGDRSPAGFVAARFSRAAELDMGPGMRAFTSTLRASEATAQVTGAWRPASRRVDATGVYLRYSANTIIIRPRAGGGTLILVERSPAAGKE